MSELLTLPQLQGSPLATRRWAASRGTNLVANGSALLGDNTNFSAWEFDGARAPSGGGSFRTAAYRDVRLSDDMMPVDVRRRYRLSLDAQESPAVGAGHYFGLVCYDVDGLQIGPEHYIVHAGAAIATLTAPLAVGHTSISVDTTAGWYNTGTAGEWYLRLLRFGGYANSYGFTYPAGGYSRRVYIGATYGLGAWNAGGIKSGQIGLAEPYAGPPYPAGTTVVNATFGGGFLYTHQNVTVPPAWTRFVGNVGGTADVPFFPGTAFVRFMCLPGNTGPTSGTLNVGSVEFEPDPAAEATPPGVVELYAGTVAPPPGWLVCNGATYPVSRFPALAAALYAGGESLGEQAGGTFAVPTLTGPSAGVVYIIRT